MPVVPSGRKARRMHLLVGAAGVLALVAGAAFLLGRPKIEGSTPNERIRSISELADERRWGAGDVIAEAAAREPDPTVRRAAIIGLGKFLGPEYRPAVEAGTRDPSPVVRSAAAGVLALYKDDAATDKLMELLAKDPDSQVRAASGDSLNQLGTPKSLVVLLEAAEKDGDPNVQVHAANLFLGRFGREHAGARPQDKGHWSNLIEYMKGLPGVEQAYAGLGRKLERRPGDRIIQPGD